MVPPPDPEDLKTTGFGLRFEPDDIRDMRETHVKRLQRLMDTKDVDNNSDTLNAISEVKGLFNRSWRQDQWDWFHAWSLIGRPNPRVAKRIGRRLGNLRAALKNKQTERAHSFIEKLDEEDSLPWRLDLYLKDTPFWRGGAFYVMSERDDTSVLYLGITKSCPIDAAFDVNENRIGLEPLSLRTAIALGDSKMTMTDIRRIFQSWKTDGDPDFYVIDVGTAVQHFSRAWNVEMNFIP